MAPVDEKTPLLPVVEPVPAPVTDTSTSIDETLPPPERLSREEKLLITSIFALISIIAWTLNLHIKNPRVLCRFHLLHFARLLPQTLYQSIPTALIFFVATPILVKPDRVVFSRCLVLFCYLFGAIWGAGIFGASRERFSCTTGPIPQNR